MFGGEKNHKVSEDNSWFANRQYCRSVCVCVSSYNTLMVRGFLGFDEEKGAEE